MCNANHELFKKLTHVLWLGHKEHLREHAEGGPMANPTRGRGRILALLKMQDSISTKDLSYLLGIRVSSLNELLAKMEKDDYVSREPSEADKRVMLVKLTEKGKNEQQQDPANHETIFSCLSDEEKNTLADYLNRIIAANEANAENSPNEDDRESWLRHGRERMGDEMFDRLVAMRHCGIDPRHLRAAHHHGFGGFPHRRPMGDPHKD